MRKKVIHIALLSLIPLIFIIVGLFTLSDYGINWDSPMRLMRGQSLLHFYLTGQKHEKLPDRLSPVLIKPGQKITRFHYSAWETGRNYPELPERPLPLQEYLQTQLSHQSSFYEDNHWDGHYFINVPDSGHLPLPDILAAISNKIFFQGLGILGDIESSELINVLFSAVGIFIVGVFTWQLTRSYLATLVASASLALFPLFFGDSHINMKDPAQASFFAGAVWSFWNWVRLNQKRYAISFGVFLALALGTKWNIIFLPIILLPWLATVYRQSYFKTWSNPIKLLKYSAITGTILIVFLLAIWPNSWSNPIKSFADLFGYYQGIGTVSQSDPDTLGFAANSFEHFPLVLLIAQTPEVILVLMLMVPLLFWLKKSLVPRNSLILIGLWLLVPLARYSLPFARTFGGIRQIMEILPAVAVLAGLGAYASFTYFQEKFPRAQTISAIITVCIIGLLLFPIIKLHPNQNAYFNHVVGGIKGMSSLGMVEWSLTYGNVYRQAAQWLKDHAEKDANIAFLDGGMFALSPVWLGADQSLSPNYFSSFDRKGEYIITMFQQPNPAVFSHRYPEKFLTPLKTFQVDGLPLLSIYKNSPENVKSDLPSETELKDITVTQEIGKDGDYWQIDLGAKEVEVTRIELAIPATRCLIKDAEVVGFLTIGETYSDLTPLKVYEIDERQLIDQNTVQYFYPGEKATKIVILPQSDQSCFIQGKITKIYGLSS